MLMHPVSLRIRPQQLEQEFWSSSHVTQQLLNIDKFAFFMSTLNLYTGWHVAGAVTSAPATAHLLQLLCLLFFVLTFSQQFYMRCLPSSYLKHRESIVLATRLVRGGWMLAMFALAGEGDIVGYFIKRKLEHGVSQPSIVLQLLMAFTLIFLGQCLYWPLPFRKALPLQLCYVGISLAVMRDVKCVLNMPAVAVGTHSVCSTISLIVDAIGCFVAEGKTPGAAGANTAAGAAAAATASVAAAGSGTWAAEPPGHGLIRARELPCSTRGGEEVLYFWITTFGLLLPLYVLYVRELALKQDFLIAKHLQLAGQGLTAQRQQQQQQQLYLGGIMKTGPLLHAVGLVLLVLLGSLGCEVLLLLLPPPECAAYI